MWSTEKLSAEEVKELLLAEDFKEQTIFHIAEERGDTEVLNKTWEWSTEKLSAEEVKNCSYLKTMRNKRPYILQLGVALERR